MHSLTRFVFSFDVELPIICDDEYMEHPDPEQAFKQPAGKPCLITCFVSMLKLMQITAFALRTIVRLALTLYFAC